MFLDDRINVILLELGRHPMEEQCNTATKKIADIIIESLRETIKSLLDCRVDDQEALRVVSATVKRINNTVNMVNCKHIFYGRFLLKHNAVLELCEMLNYPKQTYQHLKDGFKQSVK